jgi:hypothetical protein
VFSWDQQSPSPVSWTGRNTLEPTFPGDTHSLLCLHDQPRPSGQALDAALFGVDAYFSGSPVAIVKPKRVSGDRKEASSIRANMLVLLFGTLTQSPTRNGAVTCFLGWCTRAGRLLISSPKGFVPSPPNPTRSSFMCVLIHPGVLIVLRWSSLIGSSCGFPPHCHSMRSQQSWLPTECTHRLGLTHLL